MTRFFLIILCLVCIGAALIIACMQALLRGLL